MIGSIAFFILFCLLFFHAICATRFIKHAKLNPYKGWGAMAAAAMEAPVITTVGLILFLLADQAGSIVFHYVHIGILFVSMIGLVVLSSRYARFRWTLLLSALRVGSAFASLATLAAVSAYSNHYDLEPVSIGLAFVALFFTVLTGIAFGRASRALSKKQTV